MPGETTIMVALEDLATAGAVAGEAVRLAVREDATRLLLVHVLDAHTVVNSILAMAGAPSEPVLESQAEGERMLALAAQVIQGEFAALGRSTPAIEEVLGRGSVAETLGRIAEAHRAVWLVVGARRPHLFGRLTHPDVRANLAGRSSVRIHVASLQEVPTPAAE